MSEPWEDTKYQDSIRWMKIIRDLTDQALLPEKLDEKIRALVVAIARRSRTEFLQGFYFGETRNALVYCLEKPNSGWLVTYLDILEDRLKRENPYHEHRFSEHPYYNTPYYNAYAGMYAPQTQPSTHTPAQSVPKAAWSSLHADPDSIRKREHGTSHADGPGYSTKNVTKKAEKKPNPPTEAPSCPNDDGSPVGTCSPSSNLPKMGRKNVRFASATSTVEIPEPSLPRDILHQHTPAPPSRHFDNLPSNLVSAFGSTGGSSALGRVARAEESGAVMIGSSSNLAPVLSGLSTNAPGAPSSGPPSARFSSAGFLSAGLPSAGPPTASGPSSPGLLPSPGLPSAGIPSVGPPKQVQKLTENTQTRLYRNEGEGQSISGEPVKVDKQPGTCFKKHEAPAKKPVSETPRELTPGQGPKRRLLNREPVSNWNISEPVYVAIDFGAHKETRQVSSVGVSALDSSRKQQGMTSIQWMRTSETEHWKIEEAFDQRPPPPHYPLLHGGVELKVRRKDIKREFKWFMKRFMGRNVVLTFHDARNDHEWMEGLGMDPYSIRGVNIVGEFDTMIAASCKLKNPNLRVAVGWIGYGMAENEWHNSANDAFNTNRLVASMVYGLHASAGNPKFPWPEDGVFEPDNRVFVRR